MEYLENIGKNAKAAATALNLLSAGQRKDILRKCADSLVSDAKEVLAQNETDYKNALESGIKPSYLDRLKLTEDRIQAMAADLRKLADEKDVLGEIQSRTLENGLIVGQRRVPLGVVAIIYEARPNVTSDAFGICLKTGNALVLRGGSDAFNSNNALVSIFRGVLAKYGYDENFVQIIEKTDRETAQELMRLNEYIDVLIPRGGAGLINSVVKSATVPVIETGAGNCHIFVDASADFEMAANIVINAKTRRPSVCNAVEKLLVHQDIADDFLPLICSRLRGHKVEMRGDERTAAIIPDITPANEDDWYTEYNDLIISIAVVSDISHAIAHIGKYSTNHSETIVTNDYQNSQKFLKEVDSAAVYVNASTAFTDGGQFGLGAEIGISTQKLHARGPMGLREMTTTKYVIMGEGQIRE
ncbi:gamma-glutamyl phosphate reductase [Clostridia bacterium]|nr:gamma-glutamyl phosphate reductase [Clostridia bacterium]